MTTRKASKFECPDAIDLSEVKDALVVHKDLLGLQREKPGIDAVIAELSMTMATHGDEANIHPKVYQTFLSSTDMLAKVRALKVAVRQLYKALEHSEVHHEHARELAIGVIATNAVTAANQDEGLRAAFKDTINYRSQYASKAAATRRKNDKRKAQQEEAAAQPAEPVPEQFVKSASAPAPEAEPVAEAEAEAEAAAETETAAETAAAAAAETAAEAAAEADLVKAKRTSAPQRRDTQRQDEGRKGGSPRRSLRKAPQERPGKTRRP